MDEGKRESTIRRVTWVGALANLGLLIVKFVAGLVAHSSAMVADAVHSLSDFVTDIIVIVFVVNFFIKKHLRQKKGAFHTLALPRSGYGYDLSLSAPHIPIIYLFQRRCSKTVSTSS